MVKSTDSPKHSITINKPEVQNQSSDKPREEALKFHIQSNRYSPTAKYSDETAVGRGEQFRQPPTNRPIASPEKLALAEGQPPKRKLTNPISDLSSHSSTSTLITTNERRNEDQTFKRQKVDQHDSNTTDYSSGFGIPESSKQFAFEQLSDTKIPWSHTKTNNGDIDEGYDSGSDLDLSNHGKVHQKTNSDTAAVGYDSELDDDSVIDIIAPDWKNYSNVKLIGGGEEGRVFLFRNKEGHEVAKKQLFDFPTEENLNALRENIDTISNLKSDYVITYIDADKDKGGIFVILEKGHQTLEDFFDETLQNLPNNTRKKATITIIKTLFDAVTDLRDRGFIHQDPNFGNWIFSDEGALKAIDLEGTSQSDTSESEQELYPDYTGIFEEIRTLIQERKINATDLGPILTNTSITAHNYDDSNHQQVTLDTHQILSNIKSLDPSNIINNQDLVEFMKS